MSDFYLIDIGDVRTADTFPTTVVEKRDGITIDTAEFIAITIHRVPVSALFDQEIAVSEDIGAFVRITIHFTAGTMVDIPIAGTALNRYVAERIIIKILAVDAAYQISVFVCEIPGIASSDTVVAVIEEVYFVAVKDGIAAAIDIDGTAGSHDIATVPEILVVVGTSHRFAGRHLIAGILEPQVILVGHDVLG